MSYLYLDIAKAVALRANQLAGGAMADVEAAYTGLTLQGVEVPTTALKNVVLATAAELAAMVGNSANALFRGAISANSAVIADGGDIPTQDVSANPFIGSLEGFYDTSVAPIRALTEGTLQQIDRYRKQTFWKINPFLFAETGTKLRHTGTTVVARGCAWDPTAQATAYDTAQTTPATFTFVAANVSAAANTIAHTAHGLYTGAKVRAVIGTGLAALPAPLVDQTVYYAIVVDADTIKLATTLSNALANVAIDLTNVGTNGTLPNSIAPVEPYGGGICPLPVELKMLHVAMVLELLPSEGWFVQEAEYYSNLVDKKAARIIAGKEQLMELPQIPKKTASADPIKD